MRSASITTVFLLLASMPAFSCTTIVRAAGVELIRATNRWRFVSVAPAVGIALRPGEELLSIDGFDASKIGPLAVAAALNAGFVRTVPLTIHGDDGETEVALWKGDGPAPRPDPNRQNRDVSTGDDAPDFELYDLKGRAVWLRSHKAHWVLISFWATWCRPCLEEAPVLEKLARMNRRKLDVVAVAVNDTREALESFETTRQPAYTILNGGTLNAEPALSYGVGRRAGGGSVPVNVLVRPDGTVAFVQGGYEAPSPLEQEVKSAIARCKGDR
jgi:thiol-disulfide isomerase/thioredoxin